MPEPLTKGRPCREGLLRAAAFALALAGILTPALPAAEAGEAPNAGKRVKTMQGAPASAPSRKALPSIDLEAPSKTETATFALG
jgi:hypothetical protein